jgi:hypothetical protein
MADKKVISWVHFTAGATLSSLQSQATVAAPAAPASAPAPGEGLPEVEVLMKNLLAAPGVEGYLIFNDNGTET